eukprot:TCONS_00033109-protein
MKQRLDQLKDWSTENNIAFNNKKTKIMLLSTSRMGKLHDLANPTHPTFHIHHTNQLIERVIVYKLLGVQFDENLNWEAHVNKICQSVYKLLGVQFDENLNWEAHVNKICQSYMFFDTFVALHRIAYVSNSQTHYCYSGSTIVARYSGTFCNINSKSLIGFYVELHPL